MKSIRALSILVAGASLWASSGLHAAQCTQAPSSFTDVQPTDAFCTDVEWLKNRGVTLGCTGTEYCPIAFVTRAQMALFMKRLTEAIVPEPIFIKESIGGRTVTVFPLDNQFCQVNVPDVPNAVYPRAFRITGSVHIVGPSGPGPISAAVRHGDNGGSIMAIEQVDATITSGVELHLPIVMLIKLGPGPKTFRMTLHTISPPVVVNVATCTLRVEASSVTGASPPY